MINLYNNKPKYLRHKNEYDLILNKIINKGHFINGKQVIELEKELAEYVGVKNCIALSSGTDALLLALMALNIKPGDEVITTPFTWISTSEVIKFLKAVPVFIDINKETYNMDEKLIESKITNKTKVILPVSLYGNVCNMDKIMEIAQKYELYVIEDAAQSMGAIYNEKKSGSIAHISCTSFYPTKPLGGWGDGGACFTDNDGFAEKIRCIRNHGCLERHHHTELGLNARMDTIQAGVILVNLKHFEESINNRIKIAERYNEELKVLNKMVLPKKHCDRHVYAQYTILLESKKERSKFISYMKDNKISVGCFYPKPLYRQPCLKEFEIECKITEEICDRCISLPCYDGLSNEEQEKVIKHVKKYFLNYFVHETSIIDENVKIGENSKIWHYCHISDNVEIGSNVTIGQNCFIDKGVKIGNNCKIQNNVSVYKGVSIENNVFVGPSVVFTNDLYPSASNTNWEICNTKLKDGCAIGANSTIVCGVTINEKSLIGAGSVVTKDVEASSLYFGNPAKFIKKIKI